MGSLCFHVTRVPDRFVCPRCKAVMSAPPDKTEITCPSCHSTLRKKAEGGAGGHKGPTLTPETDEVATKDEEQCIVCMDKKKCVLIYPCGHVCVCQGCAQRLQ